MTIGGFDYTCIDLFHLCSDARYLGMKMTRMQYRGQNMNDWST